MLIVEGQKTRPVSDTRSIDCILCGRGEVSRKRTQRGDNQNHRRTVMVGTLFLCIIYEAR